MEQLWSSVPIEAHICPGHKRERHVGFPTGGFQPFMRLERFDLTHSVSISSGWSSEHSPALAHLAEEPQAPQP